MTQFNLDDLECAARAVTDGPWAWDSRDRMKLRSPSGYRVLELRDGFCAADDPAYIAAASPDVVLALIAIARTAAGALTKSPVVEICVGNDAPLTRSTCVMARHEDGTMTLLAESIDKRKP